MVTKPNVGPHAGVANNPIHNFALAMNHIQRHPNRVYLTTGNQKPFLAVLGIAHKAHGTNKGSDVIKFVDRLTNKEKARAYPCCWGKMTNCTNQWINCYTEAIQ